MKYALHILLLTVINYFAFTYIPTQGYVSDDKQCIQVGQLSFMDKGDNIICYFHVSNPFLQIFYVLYSIYFLLSSFQLKYGINDLKVYIYIYIYYQTRNSLMERFSVVHATIFRFYRALPFLFELRTIYDWTFSVTSLNLFQWIKVEDSNIINYNN